nr:immunoglobulin light chain junction region [Macaca mulatta]MOW30552.1 immunoglobulin light chain junction region [Macaca mulatta]
VYYCSSFVAIKTYWVF